MNKISRILCLSLVAMPMVLSTPVWAQGVPNNGGDQEGVQLRQEMENLHQKMEADHKKMEQDHAVMQADHEQMEGLKKKMEEHREHRHEEMRERHEGQSRPQGENDRAPPPAGQ